MKGDGDTPNIGGAREEPAPFPQSFGTKTKHMGPPRRAVTAGARCTPTVATTIRRRQVANGFENVTDEGPAHSDGAVDRGLGEDRPRLPSASTVIRTSSRPRVYTPPEVVDTVEPAIVLRFSRDVIRGSRGFTDVVSCRTWTTSSKSHMSGRVSSFGRSWFTDPCVYCSGRYRRILNLGHRIPAVCTAVARSGHDGRCESTWSR